jgi:gamma-glutamyltranspeptidase/glutathione hydrolase
MTLRRFSSVRATRAMVASADQIATQAGLRAVAIGGNAVDAAIATNAAIAVTGPHMCGLGGDLFALVHSGDVGGEVHALNATGRAGSGADAAALRDQGHTEMPFALHLQAVTVPGCVDGWIALHDRFGTVAMADLLEPAIRLAEEGFPASPLLVGSLAALGPRHRLNLRELAEQAVRVGARVQRPGVARMLRAVAQRGRDGFYLGEFGHGFLELGEGLYSHADLARPGADWHDVLTVETFGARVHSMPPNSQGYLTLGALLLAEQATLPGDPGDPQWAHILIECATAAGFDRPDVLSDRADGDALIGAIRGRGALVDADRASARPAPWAAGDTTYLCTMDVTGMGVSLIQSNASNFGSGLVEPNTQINLHNRGMAFNLRPGHPAELAPGRRPPHTLSPAMITRGGRLETVVGTMGGDAQPQILLQLITRLLLHGQSPAEAIDAARWVLSGPATGFDTWTGGRPTVVIEGHAPPGWLTALPARGHPTVTAPAYDSTFGHAHLISRDAHGFLAAAADPRTVIGTAAGL